MSEPLRKRVSRTVGAELRARPAAERENEFFRPQLPAVRGVCRETAFRFPHARDRAIRNKRRARRFRRETQGVAHGRRLQRKRILLPRPLGQKYADGAVKSLGLGIAETRKRRTRKFRTRRTEMRARHFRIGNITLPVARGGQFFAHAGIAFRHRDAAHGTGEPYGGDQPRRASAHDNNFFLHDFTVSLLIIIIIDLNNIILS